MSGKRSGIHSSSKHACLLLAVLSLLQLAVAIKLVLPPGKTECVLERVDDDHFQVGS